MPIDGDGEYQLLAGLRRLRAGQTLGWEQIAVTVVSGISCMKSRVFMPMFCTRW